MKRSITAVAASTLLIASLAGGANDNKRADGDAQSTIQSWPAESKKAAQTVISKYGQPDEMTASHLMWKDNGPWKKTVVYKEEVDHRSRRPTKTCSSSSSTIRSHPTSSMSSRCTTAV